MRNLENATLNFAQLIRQLAEAAGADAPLSEEQAERLFSAALDGGIADLELGAVLIALSGQRLTPGALLGLHRAASARSFKLPAPQSGVRPIVIPAYGGGRARHNLLPLLVLLLRGLGISVVWRGARGKRGGAGFAFIFRE